MQILEDIRTAVMLTGQVRKARKAGASAVQIRPVYILPVSRYVANGGFGGTAEGHCLFWYKDIHNAVRTVYETFDTDAKRALQEVPKDGEWADRMRFWERELRPVLAPAQYHKAMVVMIGWAIRCVKRRRGA